MTAKRIQAFKGFGSSGDYARIEATGEHSVIASAGRNTWVKCKVGTWVSLAEFDDDGKCIGFASGQIEKSDVWYRAKNGKLVEVKLYDPFSRDKSNRV